MKKRSLVWLVVAFVCIGFGIYKYTYQEHRNIEVANVDFTVDLKNFLEEFVANSDVTTQKYLNKVIAVQGVVSEKDAESVTLSNSILCYFTTKEHGFSEGTSVKIKGRCIGFDELLEVVKLDQCSVEK